ncbi:MAG: ferrous iron transport protein A [Gammaproteobacteria bacterium]|nr:MAG: ferrous iron transport protein A [Gammaproteobacteria bacterium]TND01496.1 MAG: ferrous iron transport protein A [Gammaproteobacteria bacterium]
MDAIASLLTLLKLQRGDTGVIARIDGHGPVKQRLAEMGFTKGATVGLAHTAPFGNPRTYLVRGYRISLRNEDADKVILESYAGVPGSGRDA